MTTKEAYDCGFKLAMIQGGLSKLPSEKILPPKKDKDKNPKPVGYNYLQDDRSSGTWK